MNGIEILNQYEVVASYTWSWSTFWCWFFPILVVIFLFGVGVGCIDGDPIGGGVAGGILGLVMSVAISSIFALGSPETYTPVYQVIISEEVSLTEFYDKYDIIKQEGQIFTVKEKIKSEENNENKYNR